MRQGASGIDFHLPTTDAKTTYMVPMRDGVRLATDVYLPDDEGPWPVVLYRSPYNKNTDHIGAFAASGYAAVAQDVRGKFSSEGETCVFLCDGHDAAVRVAAELAGAGVCRTVRVAHGPVPGARVVDGHGGSTGPPPRPVDPGPGAYA